MQLHDLYLAGSATHAPYHVTIHDGKFLSVTKKSAAKGISFGGAMAYPGFINSHDHLDFNLFQPMSNKVYANYTEWGKDIHLNNKTDIDKVLAIPVDLRIQWGLYKNLLNGFTTVINHGAFLPVDENLVSVHQEMQCLHSVSFEPYWKYKLNRPSHLKKTLAIHIGEGTDRLAKNEIDRLIKWNVGKRSIVGIHGVAMNADQAKHFSALVWCPASNYFLLGDTAQIQTLKQHVPVLFGSDSTLTSGWNIWEHQQTAKDHYFSPEEWIASMTTTPASVWKLPDRGQIAAGKRADLVIALPGANEYAPVMQAPEDIMMVVHKGSVRLFDECLYDQLPAEITANKIFTKIRTGQRYKYVEGDLAHLAAETKKYCPDISLPILIQH